VTQAAELEQMISDVATDVSVLYASATAAGGQLGLIWRGDLVAAVRRVVYLSRIGRRRYGTTDHP
jgi:hypothetical protein